MNDLRIDRPMVVQATLGALLVFLLLVSSIVSFQ